MTRIILASLIAGIASAASAAGVANRARDFMEALEKAKAAKSEIVVLQRGSDWNKLGETLHSTVWQKPEFAKELGAGFVLVAVDRPEGAGELLAKVKANLAILPPNDAAAVKSEAGATFTQRADGSWLVQAEPKAAATDVLALSVKSKTGGTVLRLDFLPDAALPTGGAGRSENGNFVISEMEISQGGKPVKVLGAWASSSSVADTLPQLTDGIADKPENGWNAKANEKKQRTLLFALDSALGADAQVRLICKTKWAAHSPGCVRAAVLRAPEVAAEIVRMAADKAIAEKNKTFTWWDGSHCPRIAVLDSEGRAIAAEDKPRLDLTPAKMAARVKELREKRIRRDDLWAKAGAAQGPERAELLRQGLDVLGFANWKGNADCYEEVHAQIKAADPEDKSGATRWLGFSSDVKGGVPWAKPTWSDALKKEAGAALSDADYTEALARVDKELADPRNRILTHENIQRMMVAKYHIYKRWKGREDDRFIVQREIAAFDPTTFWGIGATGYLGMFGKSDTPMFSYGWKPAQLKSGTNTWRMTDTGYTLDHAGPYLLKLRHAGGKNGVKVKHVAFLDGTTVLAEARPDADFAPGAKLDIPLDCTKWQAGRAYAFLIELEAADGKTDCAGTFSLEPVLVEKPAPLVAGQPADFAALRKSLASTLGARFSKSLDAASVESDAAVRKGLALHELIRRCGEDALTTISKEPGGTAFLKVLTNDVAWMESLLANDDAKWADVLSNLRVLHHNSAGLDQPLARKIATALAFAGGKMNDWRLVDRFAHIQRAHRDGLMHAKFDALSVREMRWAVWTAGTTADYEFMLDDMQQRWSDYLGACWAIPYIDPNVYGYSVQGWGYVDEWVHHYGNGMGDRPYRIQRTVGGVCGTLSGYAAAAAKVHGVMATTVGQPGHCAFVVRVGDEWPTGNDVSGPETNGASALEGTGFPTMHRLYEVMHSQAREYLTASRLSWAAHVLHDATIENGKPKWNPAWNAAFAKATAAQPINYTVWLDFIKTLEPHKDVPPATWRAIATGAAAAFAPYHEAGWALVNRALVKVSPSITPAERVALMLECQQQLRQENAPKFMGYNVSGPLNKQADLIGDPATTADYFAKLMTLHRSEDPTKQRVLGEVINWGRERFSKKPATAPLFVNAMASFFASQGDGADKKQMQQTIAKGIRTASETGDKTSYQLWNDLAEKLLPPAQPADIHLTAKQLAEAPKVEPFSGDIVSTGALLQTSSASVHDTPLAYARLLAGTAPGWLQTSAEEKAWLQIELPGDCELTGLALVNRYEYKPDHAEFLAAAPLKVSLSTDGKTWTDAGVIEKAAAVMRLDLTGKTPRTRFVRVARIPADGTPPAKPSTLQLRNAVVFGKKLY